MSNQGVCLAATDGLGQVYDCGSCGNIHVQVGPVNITLEPKAYMQLVEMISTSAANFETWLQARLHSGAGRLRQETTAAGSQAALTPVELRRRAESPPQAAGLPHMETAKEDKYKEEGTVREEGTV